ncbi:MAG TPA: TonB family protein [Vicinamibacteria bacterium]|nr:TonB family protein [Vicinamibacteria bacterium]
MSGAVLPNVPAGPRATGDLFTGLVVSDPPRVRRAVSWPVSIAGHVIAAALLVLVPILWQEPPPEHTDYIRALLYNPPPPPPPPLPRGSAVVEKPEAPKPVTPEIQPHKPEFTAPVEQPVEEKPLEPESRPPDTEQAGSLTGSDMGVPEGMEVGVEGGVVGGVPGGVIGGVIGGTGDIPVMDYDQPPRIIKQTRPIYPQEAFIKKIEGTVELEILIDTSGRVRTTRVLKSVPLLDQAAIETVRQWVFAPAVKNGRPVSTIVNAPIAFRIY